MKYQIIFWKTICIKQQTQTKRVRNKKRKEKREKKKTEKV